MISISAYLHKSRHNIYYFRVVAPKPTGANAKRELRISLKTKNLSVASRYSAILKRESDILFRWLSVGEISWIELKEILRNTLSKSIKQFEDDLSLNGPKPKYTEEIWALNQMPNWKERIQEIEKSELRNSNRPELTLLQIPESVQLSAKRILKNNNIILDIKNPLYLKFCKSALEMNIALTKEALVRNADAKQFIHVSEPESRIDIANGQMQIRDKQSTKLFSVAVEMFVEEKLKGHNWKLKTEEQNRVSFELLKELYGDFDMNSVSFDMAVDFKQMLMKLPSNRNKKIPYRTMTLNQIMKFDVPAEDKLSTSKINAYLGTISSLFSWAVKHGFSPKNPFEGLKITENIANIDKRHPFSKDNILTIFDTDLYTKSKFLHPHYFWLPLLGLYTGARLNELCQLYLTDLKLESDIWVFDFNEENEKTLKYHWCKRLVPIHSSLIQSGLLGYKKVLEEKGETRLFPNLKMSEKTTYAHGPSKWFNDRYLKQIGIKHKQIAFHSFRHTVIDLLKQSHVEAALIKAITGHKDESITTGHYGSSYKPVALTPIIEKLDFGIPSYPFIYRGKDLSNFDR